MSHWQKDRTKRYSAVQLFLCAFAVIYNKHHIIYFMCVHACVRVCVCHVSPVCPCCSVRPLHQSVVSKCAPSLLQTCFEQLACSSWSRQRAVPPTHNWIICPPFVPALVFQDFYVYMYLLQTHFSHKAISLKLQYLALWLCHKLVQWTTHSCVSC